MNTAKHRVVFLTICVFAASNAYAATGRVTVRVRDADTGQLIPARLAIQAGDGTWPGDRLNVMASRWPNIEAHGVFITGEQTFELPAGATSITAAHGFEFQAAAQRCEVTADSETQIELQLKRVCHLRKSGWVAGDMHVHMMHGENERQTSYEEIAQVCSANGLDFVFVGQEYVGAGKLDLAGYHDACRKVSSESFQMFLGGECPKSLLGHQALIGVSNPFVISEDPPYFFSARKIHDQGGVSLYVHPVRYYPERQYQGQWLDFPGNNLARELIFDAYAGPSFDGLSVLSDQPSKPEAYDLWFQLLNRGFFVPVFSESDACFDRAFLGLKVPGLWTTYFYIGTNATIDPSSLAEAVRRGQTFATTGPLVQFHIDDAISGATLAPDGQRHVITIDVHAPQHAFNLATKDVASDTPYGIGRIELIRNGEIVKTWEPHEAETHIKHEITEQQPCWYVVRVFGSDSQWQVAVTSPIYFAPHNMAEKRAPLKARIRGRIYDFKSGEERTGQVTIWRGDTALQQFEARGRFQVDMPIDSEMEVRAEGFAPIRKNLLLDYGPVHKLLWYLESKDLGKAATWDRFELLMRAVDLEFALGYRMPGCYLVEDLQGPAPFESVEVLAGPDKKSDGAIGAALLLDTDRIHPGDTMHAAVIFRDEGGAHDVGPLIIEARGYDPSRPTAYGALKKFAEFEKSWSTSTDIGNGYRVTTGSLTVPKWVEPGPTGAIDITVRVPRGNEHATFFGLQIPIGATHRALSFSAEWPSMPLSWPDGNYGIGPLKITNRNGRRGAPQADYRELHLRVVAGGKSYDVHPQRDCAGCPDADDAQYTLHYFDQILADESKLAEPPTIRPQPTINWDEVPLLID